MSDQTRLFAAADLRQGPGVGARRDAERPPPIVRWRDGVDSFVLELRGGDLMAWGLRSDMPGAPVAAVIAKLIDHAPCAALNIQLADAKGWGGPEGWTVALYPNERRRLVPFALTEGRDLETLRAGLRDAQRGGGRRVA